AKAEEEHKERLEKWRACQRADFSTSPEDRQKCIDRLVKFMQPILDGVFKATGWPCTFIAGGPEPADAGRLNILSMHSGTTSGPVPMTFGTACRPAFKKYWIPVFTAFLQMCFTMEESKARSLVDTSTPSLRTQLEEQGEETNATVDGVDIPSWEGFMQEMRVLMAGEPAERTTKGTEAEAELKKSESGQRDKIAKLREMGSQSRKTTSTVGTASVSSDSTLPPQSVTVNATATGDNPGHLTPISIRREKTPKHTTNSQLSSSAVEPSVPLANDTPMATNVSTTPVPPPSCIIRASSPECLMLFDDGQVSSRPSVPTPSSPPHRVSPTQNFHPTSPIQPALSPPHRMSPSSNLGVASPSRANSPPSAVSSSTACNSISQPAGSAEHST
ncbi:SERTA domain-containing protein 3, partial [Marasmius crinis-equi]